MHREVLARVFLRETGITVVGGEMVGEIADVVK